MQGLNDGFYFVIDKIIDLQAFFLKQAFYLSRVAFLTALLLAALNHALSGTGLKENIIKIGKALVFFLIVYFAYPGIVGFITSWTFSMARDSMFSSVEEYYNDKKYTVEQEAEAAAGLKTYPKEALRFIGDEQFFGDILENRSHGKINYTTVAPAAVLKVVLLIAGECATAVDRAPKYGALGVPNIGFLIKGLICAFFVIFTGVFAVLEYLMAFMEFMLVASVGVIMLPLSIWEGSKFLSEKFYGAMIGFFIKLLFCNIAIFLMLFGFMSLAHQFTVVPFSGAIDEILMLVFSCLLFFYICKSAPGLAQSLLTGTPSLSATGAISAATGAVAGAAGALGLAKGVGGKLAGGGAKMAFGGIGALTEAGAAAGAAKSLGGGIKGMAGAFMGSLGHSAGESLKASGGDLARSLIGGGKGGAGSGGGSGAGINRHSQSQKFLGEKNADGTKKSFSEHLKSRGEAGTNAGIDYMAKKEAKQNKSS